MMNATRWLWLLLLVPIVLGLSRLRFDVEVLNLLPQDVPAVQGLRLYQEHFANARELVVTLHARDAEHAETGARVIAEALRNETNLVQQVVWQPPWLEHPGQSAELLGYLWFNQPPVVFATLTNRFAPEKLAPTLAEARQQLAISLSPKEIARLGYDPFGLTELPGETAAGAPQFGEGQELFGSADGAFRILFVYSCNDLRTYRECLDWLAQVKRVVARARAENQLSPEIAVNYTGRPAFVAEFSSGMESDMKKSVGSTVLIIAALFWWAHRRFRPLLWLLALLGCVVAGTLAFGGLLFGTLNVVSVGFAAILLGLAVDYGLVLYQEWLFEPELSAAEVRRNLTPSIGWSAVTTAGAFLVLNLSGLPGLSQLGTLVGIGIALAAIVMLVLFLPPLTRLSAPKHKASPPPRRAFAATGYAVWLVTAGLVVVSLIVLARTHPRIDETANSLRPRNSSSYATLEEIKSRIARSEEPLWLLVNGRDEDQVRQRLTTVEPLLQTALSNGVISRFLLPNALWPDAEAQRANRVVARQLAAERDRLRKAAREAGFTESSLALTENILLTWQRAASADAVFWPTNDTSRWTLEKIAARSPHEFYALGFVYPSGKGKSSAAQLEAQLTLEGVWLAGWERLGSALLAVVERDFGRVMVPMTMLLLVSLGLAFKRVREVFLSLATLAFSIVCLLVVMALAGWSWNLLNLMALPLLLGAGVDYSIHMQLALRRHGGDITATRATIGRALLLCAGTTVAGFGSNIWSSNQGMVSLGQVCATGIACAYLTSVFLLPIWWRTFCSPKSNSDKSRASVQSPKSAGHSSQDSQHSRLAAPSSLYRLSLWRLGLWVVRIVPRPILTFLGRWLADAYWVLSRHRREIVIQNLLPALQDRRGAAVKTARKLFRQFSLKLIDLWRYEAGLSVENLLGEATGWAHFVNAQQQKRGVLLLTPHLGNWELGGPWLTRHGITLQVVTLAEPGEKFTELRQASRARWNIETLVIGADPFASLEIIRRLEAGATVALLVDRPPHTSAVQVELFGRAFPASLAAAELARASGCVLLPVHIPRNGNTYGAHVLPPIPYDRAALRDRDARQQLTQQIMRAFEPIIRQYLDQWYHFVPVWPPKVRK